MPRKSAGRAPQPEFDISPEESPSPKRWRRWLIGKPRDLADRRVFQHISLIPFLAWVGLGADGLSSSCYGPEEAFKTLVEGNAPYLAVALALVMALTVGVLAYAYGKVIEQFPHGGGGYVVTTKLLGEPAGAVAGSALLVDYVLTITISIAAAGDALFSFVPLGWHGWKLPAEVLLIALLIVLNFRGVKESVLVLTPVFLGFLLTHIILIAGGVLRHAPEIPTTVQEVSTGFSGGLTALGLGGMFLLFIHAYALGGGTYTGIEAVSNGLAIMREPRVQTGKRTMFYMAASLSFTAAGLLLCYLLWDVQPEPGKTMNAVFASQFAEGLPLAGVFVFLVLITEGALLAVAAQAGFVAGPRVLANMATDSWMPRKFAALSERLTTQNGITLMGVAAIAALIYARGDVRTIVIMYSINVFITFSMTELSMCKLFFAGRRENARWVRDIWIHVIGLLMCLTILVVTTFEKFTHGGWVTLFVTGALIALCFFIRSHYKEVVKYLKKLDKDLAPAERLEEPSAGLPRAVDPTQPTAIILVGGYSGLGIHTIFHVHRTFPNYFKNLIFVSVGVIDSGSFKGKDELDALKTHTEAGLQKYVQMANRLGFAAGSRYGIGTDVVEAAVQLCLEVGSEFSRVVYFAGQLVFPQEKWFQRLLHNQTAFSIQRHLQWHDRTMVILPIRVRPLTSVA